MSMTTLRINDKDEISKIVDVHNSAFKGFFLTDLGHDFLKLYYKSVIESENGILLGAYNGDKLIGFCAACTRSAGFNYALIKQNIFSYIIAGIKILLTRPKSLLRLFFNLSKTNNAQDNGEYAEILSIAVRKEAQNSGTGKLLVAAIEDFLKQKQITVLSLTTDEYDNERTLAFYRRNGFDVMYEFETYPNRRMYRLLKKIDKASNTNY